MCVCIYIYIYIYNLFIYLFFVIQKNDLTCDSKTMKCSEPWILWSITPFTYLSVRLVSMSLGLLLSVFPLFPVCQSDRFHCLSLCRRLSCSVRETSFTGLTLNQLATCWVRSTHWGLSPSRSSFTHILCDVIVNAFLIGQRGETCLVPQWQSFSFEWHFW